MGQEYAIEVRDVYKSFKVYYDKSNQLREKVLFHNRNRFEVREILKGVSFQVKKGEAIVSLKGKTRSVIITHTLQRKLLRYVSEQKISSGAVFVTRNGKQLSRTNIWREMKKLCQDANVNPSKVFPHNFRHLFARTFYELEKDIAKLADILGHSSINTTRIYIVTTGSKHRKLMENLQLII